jgi:phosphoglycerate dehydrogenase-like enzyme
VWIPFATRREHRELLTGPIEIHELPAPGVRVRRLGVGHFVVADFWTRDFAENLRNLEEVCVVQAMSAGIEEIVGHVPEGAILCDGAGIHDGPVAEWVAMATLASRRQLVRHVLDQSRAVWKHPGLDGSDDLQGTTVLIVGYGSIGRSVESRLAPFGSRFLRVARHAREGVAGANELPSLLPTADVVVVLLPLTPATEGFVDARFIASMRPGALLVNPARGRIVDTEALADALEVGRIRAAIDVSDPEPLPPEHRLWRAPGVLITPHIAGSVSRAYDRSWRFVSEQLRRYLDGEPLLNIVTDGY